MGGVVGGEFGERSGVWVLVKAGNVLYGRQVFCEVGIEEDSFRKRSGKGRGGPHFADCVRNDGVICNRKRLFLPVGYVD